MLPTGLVIRDIHKRQTTQWIDSKHFRSYKQKICEISIALLPTSSYGEGVLSFSTDDIIQMTKRFHDVIMTARQKEMLETRKQIGTPHDQLDMSGLYSDIQLQNDDQFLVEKEVVKCNDITPDDQNVEEIVPEVPNKCEELCKEMSEIKVKEGVHNDKLKSVQSLETTQNYFDSYRRCYIADSSPKPLVPVKRDHLLQDLQRSSPWHDQQIVPDTNEINEHHINKTYEDITGGAGGIVVKIKPKVPPKTESIIRDSVHSKPLTPPSNIRKELGHVKPTSREQQSESITNVENEPQTKKSYDIISDGADNKAVKIKPKVPPRKESIKRAPVHSKTSVPPSNISKDFGHVKPTSCEQLSITNTNNEPQTNKRHDVISGEADNKPAKLKPKIPPKTGSLKLPPFHSKPKVLLETPSNVTTNIGQKDVFSECDSIIMTSEVLGEVESGPIDQNELYSTVVRPAKKESSTEAILHIQTRDEYFKVGCNDENVDKTTRTVCQKDLNDLYVSVEHIRNQKSNKKERCNTFSEVEVRPKILTDMAKIPIDQINMYASDVGNISEYESSNEPDDVYSEVELVGIDARPDTLSEMTCPIDENEIYATISDDDSNKGKVSSEAFIPKQNCDIYAEVKRSKTNSDQKFLHATAVRIESKIKRFNRKITQKSTKDYADDLTDKSDRSLNVEETEETMSVDMMPNYGYDSVVNTGKDITIFL